MSNSSSTTLPSSTSESVHDGHKKETRGGDYPPHHYPHDEENPPPPTAEDKQVEKEKSEHDPFLVGWEPNDEADPKNWSTTYKSWITFQLGMLALSASLGSSIISPAEAVIADYVGISSEAAVLVVSLYILGYASHRVNLAFKLLPCLINSIDSRSAL